MALGRRKIRLEDASAWVFNRMADVYDARPPYPDALVAHLGGLAGARGRVGDVGAGLGHLALPLAERGFDVVAIEPAQAMLARLAAGASARALTVRALHAAAESLPLAAGSLDLIVVADALHFLDAQRAGREIGRVLAPEGAFAVVQCQLADTPYMRALVELMELSAPRRPRAVAQSLTQLAAEARVALRDEQTFCDHTPVDRHTLERILRSISFIGPAMSRERFESFRGRVHALPDAPVWSRKFVVCSGRRR